MSCFSTLPEVMRASNLASTRVSVMAQRKDSQETNSILIWNILRQKDGPSELSEKNPSTTCKNLLLIDIKNAPVMYAKFCKTLI